MTISLPTDRGPILGFTKRGRPIYLIQGGAPTLLEQRATELKAAHEIVAEIKGRPDQTPTEAETSKIEEHVTKIKGIDGQIKAAKLGQAALDALGDLSQLGSDGGSLDEHAKSLGEHFVKHAAGQFGALKLASGTKTQASAAAPWFLVKANTDTHGTGAGVYSPYLTEFDRTIMRSVRPRLVVEDLLGAGNIGGNAISYLIEAGMEGAFTTVAEGAAKPQIHFIDPVSQTDALKKIAGFLKYTDEMLEDLDFIVSEINQRGVYELLRAIEVQMLNGNGTGTNLLGILNRSGVQVETSASVDDNPDALFRAITKVGTGSGLDADGLAINPLDYQKLRLMRDANGQYFGGGFFTGQYGNGGILEKPPVWGLRTVVTPAVAQGTALVGAYSQAATAYSKGGIRVESTNSHATDFTDNKITTRIETRKALAVRAPAGFVKVTLV